MSEGAYAEHPVMIRGGTVWTDAGPREADIVLDGDGRIAGVSRRSEDVSGRGEGSRGVTSVDADQASVLDASGLWVLPGAVDAHVHFRDPGLTDNEDFRTGSSAAVVGGVTTVLDMPNTLPAVVSGAVLREKRERIAGRSYVDYGLFGTAVAGADTGDGGDHDTCSQDRITELFDAGACGVKFFLGPTTGDIEAPGWGDLFQICARHAQSGAVFTFHCEDRDVISSARLRMPESAGRHYRDLLRLRPRFGELLATDGALRLSLETGARVHIAHVALSEAVTAIERAKALGAPVTAETCPQYLLLSEDDYPSLGSAMRVLPPIRSRADGRALRHGLATGTLDFVATDHAPHAARDGKNEAAWEGPFGMSGVQTLLPLLIDEALRGRCTVADVVRWTSLNPAKTYGLYPRKGSLAPGADADLVLVDPRAAWTVDAAWWRGKSRNTAFWGRSGKGFPVTTLVRGRVAAYRGEVVGSPQGAFLHGRAG